MIFAYVTKAFGPPLVFNLAGVARPAHLYQGRI